MTILQVPSDPFACLYVIEIGKGRIKVGYTIHPQSRLAQHRAAAAAYGTQAGLEWVSPPGSASQDRERALIDYCARYASKRHGREYFMGVTFRSAVWYAAQLCGDEDWLRAAVEQATDQTRHVPYSIYDLAAWLRIPRRQLGEFVRAGGTYSTKFETWRTGRPHGRAAAPGRGKGTLLQEDHR